MMSAPPPLPALPAAPPKTLDAPSLLGQSSFAALGADFYAVQPPSPLAAPPYWVGHSAQLAAQLGLPADWQHSDDWLQLLSGNATPSSVMPLASVYSGHQFGVWAGQLGDGRAILLGQIKGLEIQLKGAGKTPFSRMGDGRAVLRSSIREFLCSEAMHGLGIPTTRALCVIGSDTPVRRETLETAAVVTRVAQSFVRFGHFEHFFHHGEPDALKKLADYVIAQWYPECLTCPSAESTASSATTPATPRAHQPYLALLAQVTERTAQMVAAWQTVGFCHGVMNTDNMSILGLTLDYGPFQFLDGYDPSHICNHSDSYGRYAFDQQPQIAYWNLFCLGQALLGLLESSEQVKEKTIATLETFKTHYPKALAQRWAHKLGFNDASGATSAAQQALVERILALLAAQHVDFTQFWRRLSYWANADAEVEAEAEARTQVGTQARTQAHIALASLFSDSTPLDAWLSDYAALSATAGAAYSPERMLRVNPKYVLRNHLAELAIRAAKTGDFSKVAELQTVLESPFDEHLEFAHLAELPPSWAKEIAISCSS